MLKRSSPPAAVRQAIAIALLSSPVLTLAQQATDNPLNHVVVLGTNRSDVSALQSAAPVDVFSADDIAGLGAANLAAVLQRIAPSVNMPLGAANTFASGRYAQSASLRGMAPDQTLILINGKRQTPSAMVINRPVWGRGSQPVDINTLPISAIQRIEVLRDGAAAQYGSDAIAGVINIVLRDDDAGGSLKYQTNYFRAHDKPFGSPDPSHIVQGTLSLPLPGEQSFINFSVDANRLHHPREGYPDTATWYFPGDSREAQVDHKTSIAHFPADQDRLAGLVNTEIGLSDTLRAYGFANAAKIERWSLGGYTYPRDDRNVRGIYPEGYANVNYIIVNSYTGATGLKLDDAHLGRFDLGVGYGHYNQTNKTTNGINPSLGLDSPVGGFKVDEYTSQQFNTDLQWTREFALGALNTPATASAGLSYRHERYEIQSGDPASWVHGGVPILDGPNAGRPAPFGPGLPPQDAGTYTRTVRGGYFGLEFNPLDRLDIALAGRVEDYSDFGSTRTGKLSARYEFTPSFALRGSLGNGYRAPSLGQVGASSTSRVPIIGLTPDSSSVQTRLLPVDNAIARALGSSQLKPEKSTNIAIGAVWQWHARASLTLDVYQIDVNDKIMLSENLSGPFVRSLLTAAGYPDVQVASFYTNAAETRTRGIDLTGRYTLPHLGPGQLGLNVAYSLARTEVTDVAANPAPLVNSGLQLVGRQAIGLIEDAAPRGKLVLSGDYALHRWHFNLNVKRYGEFTEYHPTTADFDQTNEAQWITDLAVSHLPNDHLTLTVGVNNVLDSRPDLQRQQLRVLGTSKYSDLSPEGMDGTQYFASLQVKF